MLKKIVYCLVLLVAVNARYATKQPDAHKQMTTDKPRDASKWHHQSQNQISKTKVAKDCQDHWDSGARQSGVHIIYPNATYPVKVYCEHTATDSWTVIQRRMSSNETFMRSWKEYKAGFGHPQYDYWIGLDTIHHLTPPGYMKLSIALQDWGFQTQYMTYNMFSVNSERQGYRLTIGQAYGYLADDMAFANNTQFATYDRPDARYCATQQMAGWWYNNCAFALLNGKYYRGHYAPSGGYYDGIYWKDWYGYDYSLHYVSMAVARK